EGIPLSRMAPGAEKTLGSDDLSAIFGLEMAQPADAAAPLPVPKGKAKRAKKRVNKTTKAVALANKGRIKRRRAARPADTAIPAESANVEQPRTEVDLSR